jgi:peroxiredoxin
LTLSPRVAIAAFLLVLAGTALLLVDGGGSDPVERGSPAPGFSLPALEGGEVSLTSLKGQVVLINFWATWCKPCEEEMPAMERLYGEHRGAGFELLAISVGETPEVVRPFRDRLGLSFPILLDRDKSVARSYQTFRFPESYLIGRDGRVVERYVGPRQWDHAAYVDRVGRLLAGGDIR